MITMAGACTCGATGLDACACEWGDVVREMIALGYHTEPLRRAQLMPALQKRLTRVTAAARASAIRSASATWPGTQATLARVIGVSPGRVRQATAGG